MARANWPRLCYTAPPRHLLAILACIGLSLGFCMRQVLPITIQEMTVPTAGDLGPRLRSDYGEKHKWTQLQQALILMGFYIGYSASHFLTGPVINRMGARCPMITGMIISAGMTALVPIVSEFHWTMVLGIRIITGVGQSVLLPGISSLLTFWVPLESRSTIAAIIYAGAPMGTFMGIYLSAVVVAYWRNWHYAYYMWSVFTSIWIALFLAYIYSYPESHPRITTQGSSYQRADFIQTETIKLKMEKLSYACQTVATFGHAYILFTLDSYLPKYLNEILRFELEDYSIYAATPFVTMYICGIISRAVYNWLTRTKNVNADVLRLIYCTVSNLLCGCVLVLAFYYARQEDTAQTVTLIHLATFLGGFFYGGLNMLDMSIRHTKTTMSIVNGLATTAGVFAISVIAIIVRANTIAEWQVVAYILLLVEAFACVFDCMFTMAKLCLLPAEEDRRWYHNIPVGEHEEKVRISKAIKTELKRRQRGQEEADAPGGSGEIEPEAEAEADVEVAEEAVEAEVEPEQAPAPDTSTDTAEKLVDDIIDSMFNAED